MDEMVRYIFGELQMYKGAVNDIYKRLAKQRSFNRNVCLFACSITLIGMIAHARINEQNDKIDLLYRKIKQLESEKEES